MTTRATNKIINKATEPYHRYFLNDNKKILFSYESFGCRKTNFDLVGVGLEIYSTTDMRWEVKNIGEPEKEN